MAERPQVIRTTHILPFERLSPLDFERLGLWLVRREGYEGAEHLGAAGAEQGRDIVARRDGRRVVFICKRVERLAPSGAEREIKKLQSLPAEERPDDLVFLVSASVSVTTRDRARAAWGDQGSCDFWAGVELDELVKRHADILHEFFALGARPAPSGRPGVADEETALKRIKNARHMQSQTLNLKELALRVLPPEIGMLHQLTELYLYGNQLMELPPEIGQLKRLKILHLQDNRLGELPPEIGLLKDLENVTLSNNRLAVLPQEVFELSELLAIYLDGNRLTELPSEIARLGQLTTLSLHGNELKTLPHDIGKLSELTELNLSNNRLETLPEEIGELRQLSDLDLSYNALSELPQTFSQLRQLNALNLDHNRLQALGRELTQLPRLDRLFIHDNEQIDVPPEILGPRWDEVTFHGAVPAKPSEILRYYARSQGESLQSLMEAKILVVGQAGVGKTSLVNRLVNDSFDVTQKPTEGIDITYWEIPADGEADPQKTVSVNIWDFGGQEIMHATHQFFLTRRSLYLLVIDARKGDNESNLHYWLRIIRSYAGRSPVLVVTNKFEPPFQMRPNETRFRKDFAPNVRGFHQTSCLEETKTGISALTVSIRRELLSLEHIYDPLPTSFLAVRLELVARTKTDDYLEISEYEEICAEHGVDRESGKLLLRFLHDLGSVLNYSDPDSPYRLEETSILNPEWVTRGVYRILNNHRLMQAGGVLKLSELDGILTPDEGYPKKGRLFIVGLMRKFELCFDFPDASGRLLVPELLTRNEPDIFWDEMNSLGFEYHYKVLPGGILPRFIVRMHNHLTDKPTCWYSGILLEIDEHPILVRGDTQSGRLYISVGGPVQGRRGVLTAVRAELAAIHRSVPGLEVSEKVPLPRDPGKVVDYQHLRRLESLGQSRYLPEEAQGDYSIQELLNGCENVASLGEEDTGDDDDSTAEHRVLLVHGIRTEAGWAEMVRAVLEESDTIKRVYVIRYGYFDLLRFALPGPWRAGPARELTRKFNLLRSRYPQSRFSILAHSYGTFTVTKALLDNSHLEIFRFAMCGSIVSRRFPWEKIARQISEDVVNDCGTRDVLPVLASTVTLGYGATGRFGCGGQVDDRFHDVPHSGFFEPSFVERFWLPFFSSGIVMRPEQETSVVRRSPWWLSVLTVFKLWWLVPLLVAAVLYYFG